MHSIRIIAAQLDFLVGAVYQNSQQIITAIHHARQQGGDLIVFPELALCGYPPGDLLCQVDFRDQIQQALHTICQQVTGIAVILGYPNYTVDKVFNAASVIVEQQIITTYHKGCLQQSGAFIEQRYFTAGHAIGVFNLKGLTSAMVMIADIAQLAVVEAAKRAGATLLIGLTATVFDRWQTNERDELWQNQVKAMGIPLIYVNGVGGQDELVLEGGSAAFAADGSLAVKAAYFQEKLLAIEISQGQLIPQLGVQPLPVVLSHEALTYQALVLALRSYVTKNHFPGVLLGLSGGIDSALVLAIAVDALGKEQVQAVLMPSRYTSELSTHLALELCQHLDVRYMTISIEPSLEAFLTSLNLKAQQESLGKILENLQARCRGVLLMTLSNQQATLLLNTSNKTEIAVGYGTLYGDMVGGFALLKDIPKTLVYQLAAYRNQVSPLFSEALLRRPPTAELAPNQTDEASLLAYPLLDAILNLYMEQDKGLTEIIAAGFAETDVRRVVQWVHDSEYKRRQAPPGPCFLSQNFNRARPITSGFTL